MYAIKAFAVAAIVVILAGCQAVLMPTPAVATDGLIDPFVYVSPEQHTSEIPVFVASARAVSGRTTPEQFYTTNRSREVRLGLATVEIGTGMTWQEVARESRAAKRSRALPLRVTI